jgi:hypothetical protein
MISRWIITHPQNFPKRSAHYPAFVVIYHLDQLKIAQALCADPGARLLLLQKGMAVVLEDG